MSSRALRIAPLVLLLALAFAVGSVSSATAAALTKGAVKKIAAKVVAKQAPALSVAHATSADTALKATTATDALTVGGLSAGQLGVRPIVFTIPKTPYASGSLLNLNGVPAGTYLLSMHGILDTATGSSAECRVRNLTQNDYPLDVQVTAPTGKFPAITGVGYATVNAGDNLTFDCATVGNWTPGYPMHVTFTPVAGVVTGNLTTVKGTAR